MKKEDERFNLTLQLLLFGPFNPDLGNQRKALRMLDGFHRQVDVQVGPVEMAGVGSLDIHDGGDWRLLEPRKVLKRQEELAFSKKHPEAVFGHPANLNFRSVGLPRRTAHVPLFLSYARCPGRGAKCASPRPRVRILSGRSPMPFSPPGPAGTRPTRQTQKGRNLRLESTSTTRCSFFPLSTAQQCGRIHQVVPDAP